VVDEPGHRRRTNSAFTPETDLLIGAYSWREGVQRAGAVQQRAGVHVENFGLEAGSDSIIRVIGEQATIGGPASGPLSSPNETKTNVGGE
jgi:hypothetical protein